MNEERHAEDQEQLMPQRLFNTKAENVTRYSVLHKRQLETVDTELDQRTGQTTEIGQRR